MHSRWFSTKESGTCIKGKDFNTTKNYELNLGKKYTSQLKATGISN